MELFFLVQVGPDLGRKIELRSGLHVMGREEACDIALSDQKVSRRHAAVEVHESGCRIKDLGSRNGIRVNDRKKSEHELQPGDLVRLGRTLLVFHTSAEEGGLEVPTPTLDLVETSVVDGHTAISNWSDQATDVDAKEVKAALEALYNIGQRVNAVLDTAQLFPEIVQSILEVVPRVDRAAIHLIDEATGKLDCAVATNRSASEAGCTVLSRTMVEYVQREKKAVLTHDAQEDDRFMDGQSIVMQKIHTAICAPLLAKDQIIGYIYADTLNRVKPATQSDLRLIAAIGLQAGTAIENARLYENLAAEKVALARAHEKLKAAQEHLIQSEKIAAVGQLAAGIVHDVKNPIGVVTGYAEFLQKRLKKDAAEVYERLEFEDLFHHIDKGCSHALEVIQRLLHFAKPGEPEKTSHDINQMIQDVIAFVQYEAMKAEVRLEKELDAGLPPVMIEENQVKQVFINIVLNAVEAMDKSPKRLVLATSLDERDGAPFVVTRFVDNGCGMTEEQQRKVFDPFFTTKTQGGSSGGGTGLGMSMSYGIIDSHGGCIEMDSVLGEGTTFRVLLPVATGEALSKEPQPDA